MILLISFVVIAVLAGITGGRKIFTVLSPQLIATAALMPLTGYICGYFLSTLFRMNAPYVCPPGYEIVLYLAKV